MSNYVPTEQDPPFARLGGEPTVVELAERFYDAMERISPPLTALHKLDADGRVSRSSRDRFALFLIGWLGGPQHYIEQFGHPRLRMRHAHVPVNIEMRDAWVASMQVAMDEMNIRGDVRDFLDLRFADVANFLRNTPG